MLHQGEERTLKNVVHYPPDTRACIFWLRNRRREVWSESRRGASPDDGSGGELASSPSWTPRASALEERSRSQERLADLRLDAAWAQAARFFSASPMPSQLEPMKIRSMPRKMPSV